MKAVYAGSFDPFTIGHLDILKQATEIFNEVHILIAVNTEKKRRTELEKMYKAIKTALEDYPQIKVATHMGLVADYCSDNNINYLIRGLRNSSDYAYEESVAKINQEINPNLRTLYFRAVNETVSSSMVWELYTYGKEVDKYLPYSAEYLESN